MSNSSENNFLKILVYLDSVIEQNKNLLIAPKYLDDVTSKITWEQKCRSGTTPCVIAMLSKFKKTTFDNEKTQFEKLKDKFPKKNVNWVYMDGYCRSEILKAAGLTAADVPTLIYYDDNKQK